MFTILVADDEKKIRETIRDYLSSKGLKVVTACDGAEALDKFKESSFDLIILDVMMPNLNGFDACRIVRRVSNLPVLFLTAKAQEQDYLTGFECGCDDYIVKPFPLSVLYEKCMSLIKRYKGIDGENELTLSGVTLNLNNNKLKINSREIELPNKDFKILYYLMVNKNTVLNRDLILTYAWGYDFDGDSRVVDTHIKRIRKALGEKSACIKTTVNIGYSLYYSQPYIRFCDYYGKAEYCFLAEYLTDEHIAQIKKLQQSGKVLTGAIYFYYFEENDKIVPISLIWTEANEELKFMDYDKADDYEKSHEISVNGKTALMTQAPTNSIELKRFDMFCDDYRLDEYEYINDLYEDGSITNYVNSDEFQSDASQTAALCQMLFMDDGKTYSACIVGKINPNEYAAKDYQFRNEAKILTTVFVVGMILSFVVIEYFNKKQMLAQSKYTFINAAAHELKTPLAVIQNQCECIMEKVNEENNGEYVNSIYEEALRMNKLVKNLLQYNHLAANAKLEKSENDLCRLAKIEIDKYASSLQPNDLAVLTDFENECIVNCNEKFISLVIDNFLSNAIKYADKGSEIVVSIKKNKKKKHVLSVFNKGKPVSSKADKAIWNLLYKEDESRASSDNSSGMGLAVSSQILNLHKFKYGYKNRDNGVEFYFIAQ